MRRGYLRRQREFDISELSNEPIKCTRTEIEVDMSGASGVGITTRGTPSARILDRHCTSCLRGGAGESTYKHAYVALAQDTIACERQVNVKESSI